MQLLAQALLQFGDLRLEALDFFASSKEHLTLNIEFLACHQIETGEESSQECLEISFEVGRRALREQRTYFALQLLEQLAARN
jgi:hypothetical protein